MKLQEITKNLFNHIKEAAGTSNNEREVYIALAEADKVMLGSMMLTAGNLDAMSTAQQMYDNCRNMFNI